MYHVKLIKLVYFLSVGFIFSLLLTSKTIAKIDLQPVNLRGDVRSAIALSISGYDFDFGYLTPNVAERGTNGIITTVTTSASNGYNLWINDEIAGSESCLLNIDGTTRINDFSAPISQPEIWNNETSRGLGVTVFSADTNKETKWGTGTTFDDPFNKYAGIPENLTILHTSSGYKENEDNTSIGYVIDVSAGQKPGIYNGNLIITATANFN